MILNIKHTANWEYIRQRKQKLIEKNNKAENAKRKAHDYQEGDRVMLRKGSENKYEQPYSGPHPIQEWDCSPADWSCNRNGQYQTN